MKSVIETIYLAGGCLIPTGVQEFFRHMNLGFLPRRQVNLKWQYSNAQMDGL